MTDYLTPPGDLNPRMWIERWDRMQAYYIPDRAERFAVMVRLAQDTLPANMRILDLGCGPGSLAQAFLSALEQAEVVGVDLDPTLLLLARARLAAFGERAQFVQADLRDPEWVDSVAGPFDAAVSATALHWLTEDQLSQLYVQVGRLVRPGGLFLNADHVGSDNAAIQAAWGHRAQAERRQSAHTGVDDWRGFWTAYGQALQLDPAAIQARASGQEAQGIETGQSLAWHMHALKAGGFSAVDCFWRRDGDAVYGGVRRDARR